MHPRLAAAADRQSGVFTTADAAGCGYEPDEIRTALRNRYWVRLRRGVYAARETVDATDGDPVARHLLDCVAVLLCYSVEREVRILDNINTKQLKFETRNTHKKLSITVPLSPIGTVTLIVCFSFVKFVHTPLSMTAEATVAVEFLGRSGVS